MYGRWGVAPWLVAALGRLRLRRRRPRSSPDGPRDVFSPPESARRVLMGTYQRGQLAAIRVLVDVVYVSIEPWTRQLAAWWPRRPTLHLPVGSNLPDMASKRKPERERLGIGDDVLVLAAFGTGHPSSSPAMSRSAQAPRPGSRRVLLLHLGDGAPPLSGLDSRIEVCQPGALSADAVARHLACADVFLAPFSDGVSTRAGLMAALQHGLPVIGTSGTSTDAVLAMSTSAMRLVNVDDLGELRAAVREVSEDARLRRSMGRSARELYLQIHWPVIAERLPPGVGRRPRHARSDGRGPSDGRCG